MELIVIGRGDRVLIVGQNKSGKSTLANYFARGWGPSARMLAFDPRLDPDMELPNMAVAYGVKAALRAMPGRVLYRPTPAEFDRLPQAFDQLIRKLWLGGAGAGVLVHETMMVAPSTGSQRFLRTVITQGRKLGATSSVPMIFATQRPVHIDPFIRTEATHVCLFTLHDRDDLRVMAGLMGVPASELAPPAEPHSFYYRGPSGGVRLIPPLNLG